MKASEAMVLWAGEFVGLARDMEEKQGRLSFAVAAWNIACLPWKKRKAEMTRLLIRIREKYPQEDHQAMRHDLELLVENKLRMFPDDRRPFLSARIEKNEQGKDAFTVTYMPSD